MRIGAALGLGILIVASGVQGAEGGGSPDPKPRAVVVDAGHGGADYGARGLDGLLEKELTLDVAQHLGWALERAGYTAVHTRRSDRFVSLVERTEIANRLEGSLFVSLHGNASPDAEVAGIETYFLSKDATDEEALRLAEVENAYLQESQVFPGSESIVGNILQDLVWTAHLEQSSRLASEIQRRLARLPGPSRGVRQAPFVVLMGVKMPAVLVEMGFLTHPVEGRRLREKRQRRSIATALAEAVRAYHEKEEEGSR
jgi:N-acetylmuramoyl-L-alanine amidase